MKYSLRNFALTFIISLVIFGAIAWGIVGSLMEMSENILAGAAVDTEDNNNPSANEQQNNTPDIEDEPEFKGNSFNFLAVGMDTMPGGKVKFPDKDSKEFSSMEAIMLVRADKENKKFIFSSLPTDFIINYKGENMPLGQLTKCLNINDSSQLDLLLNEITALTGMSIDYYAFIDMESFVKTIDNLGGISYKVPTDMYYEDPEQNLVISFKKNQKLTSAKDMLMMLRYVTYDTIENGAGKNENARISLHMQFANAVFEKMLTFENIVSIPIWIPDIFKSTKTNFTLDDAKENVDLIFSYNEYSTINFTYSTGYINQVTEKYSSSEPNKELIKAAVARLSSETGKLA